MAIKKANNKSKLPQKKQTHTTNAKSNLSKLKSNLPPDILERFEKIHKASEQMRKEREANPIILNDTSKQRLAEWENKMKLQEQQVNDWLKRIIAVRKKYNIAKEEFRKQRYQAISEAYSIFIEAENAENGDFLYAKIRELFKEHNVKVQSNTPDASLIIRFIFGDIGTAQIFKYGSVLQVAKHSNIKIEDFTKWISEITITGAVQLSQLELQQAETYKERLARARIVIMKYLEIREVKPFATTTMLARHLQNYLSQNNSMCVMLGTGVRKFDRESDYADLHINAILPPNLELDELIVNRFAKYIVNKVDHFENEIREKEEKIWAEELQHRLQEAGEEEALKAHQLRADKQQAARFEDELDFQNFIYNSRGERSAAKKKLKSKSVPLTDR